MRNWLHDQLREWLGIWYIELDIRMADTLLVSYRNRIITLEKEVDLLKTHIYKQGLAQHGEACTCDNCTNPWAT